MRWCRRLDNQRIFRPRAVRARETFKEAEEALDTWLVKLWGVREDGSSPSECYKS